MSTAEQPTEFSFTSKNRETADRIIARYPEGRQASAVMPLLDMAQRQARGWLPKAAMDHVAEILDMAPIRVYEVATFYTMYNLEPVGEHVVQVCTTTPCALRDCAAVVEACREELGIEFGETTEDGKFTLFEVECLGACVNAPMMQIGDDYFEDLSAESTKGLLQAFRRGDTPRPGPQSGRKASEPADGLTSLTDISNGAGG
ncbi:MAG: NADH-quinone oxidoreductase subunit NuoE [Rhodospirillaceae bacterium]|jgi:NADH-quinone oxidoreductase subunit E|nr:NADH-quinone oxidoreductase subunit NuoE [Rhodospirillaceae bacterium]MBT6429929.1 NADH-quinone oxidoreductase subunit NuoE [Rhodospirillaceae bacterium]